MDSVPDDQLSVKSEDLATPRVKFLCSHGGKILPRPQDGQLRYVGGETRMVAINRSTSYEELMAKLITLFGTNLWLKYQLPNEDLDSLISVTCDEDVDNMMDEYDRNEAREGALRLRAFLFPATRSFGPRAREFLDEPKSPEQKYVDAVNGVRTPLKTQVDSVPTAFQLPDYLFGLDPSQQRHHEGEVFSPTQRDPSLVLSSVKETSTFLPLIPSQADHSRHQTSMMDTGVRGPALATSALGPLMPNPPLNQPMRETKKVWDGGMAGEQRGEQRDEKMWENIKIWDGGIVGDWRGEQRDEKRTGDVNGDANYGKLQRDVGVEVAISRIPSNDRLLPRFLEGSSDSHLLIHGKLPLQNAGMILMEMRKPEEVRVDVPPIFTDVGSGGRFQRDTEMQRGIPQPNFGAVEVPRGLLQSNLGFAQGFDAVTERPQECRRSSGESDQELLKKFEGQVVVENVSHSRPISTRAKEGQADAFKYQDVRDFYKGEENMVLQRPQYQQQQQQKQGESEMSIPHFAQQVDAAQLIHHLGKGHIQQVYWQAWENQEQQQEASWVHSAPMMQRIVGPPSSQMPSLGVAATHSHRVPTVPNNVKTMPRVDALANARPPSSHYRQAGTAGRLRSDLQQQSREVIPLHDDPSLTGGLPVALRYGARIVPIHEGRVLRSTTNQQSLGVSLPPSYRDPLDPHAIYEHNGRQVQYPEKVVKGNHDMAMGPGHYQEKFIKANYDSIMGQVHRSEDNMKATHQYSRTNSFQDSHSEGFHQDNSGLHHHQ